MLLMSIEDMNLDVVNRYIAFTVSASANSFFGPVPAPLFVYRHIKDEQLQKASQSPCLPIDAGDYENSVSHQFELVCVDTIHEE